MTAQELFEQLCAPFPVEMVEWRVGPQNRDKTKGKPLCYIDARAVMDRLDTVCGPDGWQCSYAPMGKSTVCNIGIRIGGDWIWKADGAGATDFEAEKGELSDAFKRAAVRWGVGRYLYEIDSPWVALTDGGKHIAEGEKARLEEAYEKYATRFGWGNPTEVAAYRLLLQEVKETVRQPADVIAFKERNKGMIPNLRVGMRKHLLEQLDRIGGARIPNLVQTNESGISQTGHGASASG